MCGAWNGQTDRPLFFGEEEHDKQCGDIPEAGTKDRLPRSPGTEFKD